MNCSSTFLCFYVIEFEVFLCYKTGYPLNGNKSPAILRSCYKICGTSPQHKNLDDQQFRELAILISQAQSSGRMNFVIESKNLLIDNIKVTCYGTSG